MQCVSSMVPHGENKQGVSDSTFYKITLVFVTVNSEPDKVWCSTPYGKSVQQEQYNCVFWVISSANYCTVTSAAIEGGFADFVAVHFKSWRRCLVISGFLVSLLQSWRKASCIGRRWAGLHADHMGLETGEDCFAIKSIFTGHFPHHIFHRTDWSADDVWGRTHQARSFIFIYLFIFVFLFIVSFIHLFVFCLFVYLL